MLIALGQVSGFPCDSQWKERLGGGGDAAMLEGWVEVVCGEMVGKWEDGGDTLPWIWLRC